jgi:hypothetical protein
MLPPLKDQQLCIWDLATMEVIFSQKLLNVASVFKWVDQKKVGHYNAYEAVVAVGSVLQQGLFTYDPMRVQWSLKLHVSAQRKRAKQLSVVYICPYIFVCMYV